MSMSEGQQLSSTTSAVDGEAQPEMALISNGAPASAASSIDPPSSQLDRKKLHRQETIDKINTRWAQDNFYNALQETGILPRPLSGNGGKCCGIKNDDLEPLPLEDVSLHWLEWLSKYANVSVGRFDEAKHAMVQVVQTRQNGRPGDRRNKIWKEARELLSSDIKGLIAEEMSKEFASDEEEDDVGDHDDEDQYIAPPTRRRSISKRRRRVIEDSDDGDDNEQEPRPQRRRLRQGNEVRKTNNTTGTGNGGTHGSTQGAGNVDHNNGTSQILGSTALGEADRIAGEYLASGSDQNGAGFGRSSGMGLYSGLPLVLRFVLPLVIYLRP